MGTAPHGARRPDRLRSQRIELSHFERLADKAEVSRERVLRIVRETVQRAMATWPADSHDPARLAALRAHVERLPLLREAG